MRITNRRKTNKINIAYEKSYNAQLLGNNTISHYTSLYTLCLLSRLGKCYICIIGMSNVNVILPLY